MRLHLASRHADRLNGDVQETVSSLAQTPAPAPARSLADRASNTRLRAWFYAYLAYLLALSCAAWGMLRWTPVAQAPYGPVWALLTFTVYVSLAGMFLPLPTAPLIVAMAGPVVSLCPHSFLGTVAPVAVAGAIGSTIANINDYHLMLAVGRLWQRARTVRPLVATGGWLVRRVPGAGRIRLAARTQGTRLYALANRWFARSPFILLTAFNLLPIPVDAARVLAVTSAYPLGRFALANLLGRLVRYAVLAGLAYTMGWGLTAMVVLVAVAGGMVLLRMLLSPAGRLLTKARRAGA